MGRHKKTEIKQVTLPVSPFGAAKQAPKIIEMGKPVIRLTFGEALMKATEGYKITKLEWNDREVYGIIFMEKLMIKTKVDGKLHEWIIRDADILGKDWITL